MDEVKLPHQWKKRYLGELGYIKGRIGWRGLAQSEYTEYGPFLIAGKHIKNGKIDWLRADHITKDRYEESLEIALEIGDIIFSKDGTLGNPAFIDYLPDKATINGTMMLVRSLNKYDLYPKFLYYSIDSRQFKKLIYEKVSGSSIPHLFQRDMKNFKIVLPPLNEQKKIANVLSTWDQAIDLNEKKLQVEKRVLAQIINTLTKKNNFINTKYDPISIDKCALFVNGYAFQSDCYEDQGEYNIVTIGNVQDGELNINSQTKKVSKLPVNINKHQILSKDDIIISMTGNVGRVCVVNKSNLLLNQRVGKFIVEPNIDKSYFYYSLRSKRFLSKMIAKAQGGAQPNLSTKDIKNYYINIPEYKKQVIIGKYLNLLDKKINLLKNEVDLLKVQKKGLMQQLLIGKIRVQP
ncbi:restriction endonuclease subunit S [Mycoplasmatota bacterium]|nr:restriction endonuclease subunit S [Mycoplasmatota bacterium]